MKRKFYILPFTLIILVSCMFFSCDQFSSRKKIYEPTFSVDSSTRKMLSLALPNAGYYESFEPFVKYLNGRLKNIRIQIIAAKNFEDYLRRLGKREFDFTIVSGLIALDEEQNGYTIVGKIKDDDEYRGVIIVNKDSAISRCSDLNGKTIASPGKDALAGHMMPMYFLHQNGVNVKTGINILNLASFESAILNVYHGNCSAGFSSLSSWRGFIKKRPEIESKVQLKWTTNPMTNVALLFRKDLNTEVVEELKTLIFNMHNAVEGRKNLKLFDANQFVPANTLTYYPLKKFLKEYNSLFQ
jgi:phosphonate transport system substrate-binding protein